MAAIQVLSAKRLWLPASSYQVFSQGWINLTTCIFYISIFRFKNTAGVADYTKGVTGVDSIAKSNPDKAINNAE